MALTKNKNEETLGKIEIAPEVIGVIAGLAAAEVENVAGMQGSFTNEMRERLGGAVNHSKGVKIDLTEEGIVIDVYCYIQFGATIPLLAQNIQDSIRETILNMTGLEVTEVNIHIVGVQFERQETLSFDELEI